VLVLDLLGRGVVLLLALLAAAPTHNRDTSMQRCEPFFFTVPVPTFEKLWFRFRFQLLKSYGSGSYF
jgi:hypothetical protein